MCEAFGLISADEATALNGLRKIRNAAAHFDQKGRGFDVLFDSPQTIEQVKAFNKHLNLEVSSDKPEHVRTAFIQAGRLLASKLFMRLLLTNRPAIAKSSREEANISRERMKDSPIGAIFADAEKAAKEGNPEKLMELLHMVGERLKQQTKKNGPTA